MPCHNEEATIGKCLRSIYQMTIPKGFEIEVIVVNDRSSDNSAKITEKFPVKLINKYWTKTNPYAETVNLGIQHAKGDYIAIIDADIEVAKEWLAKLLPHFAEKDVGTVSGYRMVLWRGSWVNKLHYLMQHRRFLRDLTMGEVLYQEIFPTSGSYIFPRSVFEEVGLFDGSAGWATDIALNLKIRAHGYKQIIETSAIVYDLREYTPKQLMQISFRRGMGAYQSGGSLLYLHQELLFRYIFLFPFYSLALFRSGRSLISLLFPIYALIRYFCTMIGYFKALIRREERVPCHLRKAFKQNEIKWMLSSFKRTFRKISNFLHFN